MGLLALALGAVVGVVYFRSRRGTTPLSSEAGERESISMRSGSVFFFRSRRGTMPLSSEAGATVSVVANAVTMAQQNGKVS